MKCHSTRGHARPHTHKHTHNSRSLADTIAFRNRSCESFIDIGIGRPIRSCQCHRLAGHCLTWPHLVGLSFGDDGSISHVDHNYVQHLEM